MTEVQLPTGAELDRAVAGAKAGELPAAAFAAALLDATLMLAVTARSADAAGASDEAVDPFVLSVDGVDYGVAFSGPRTYDGFTAATPFVLLAGRDLGRSWPARLGLAINPGAQPSLLLSPENLSALVGGEQPGPQIVPAGTDFRIGAPDPGLPEPALELLRRLVRSDPTVQAVYPLALSVGGGPVELVIGVEATGAGQAVAEAFAARVLDADGGFRGLAFLDLTGRLLAGAQASGTRLD
jgi:SseB protein N-terminal domain